MGIIKENNYSQLDMRLALLGRAIGHPARKKIIDILQSEYVTRNTDLTKLLNLTVKSVSEHLSKLRDARLIDETYHIHFNEIRLNLEGFNELQDYLDQLKMK